MTTTPVGRPGIAARTVTARYRGRKLSVSGPHRIYPSGLWYFRSSAGDAPTWIPAADLTELADPAASACDVGVHERVAATALPVIASGLGFVGAACATASTAFRATFVPRSRAGSRRSRAVESG